MKFSIVIPTRNRLDLLRSAVASVVQQNYSDWELIISDNASNEDIAGFVDSLNESRIKYSRSENYLSITENWNRSIDMSSGDYVIMIGDDDALLKNHLQITHNLIEKFEQPDLIYTNAYLYAYPGVIPSFPKGVFQPFGSLYGMPKHNVPFWLDQSYKKAIIQATLEFRCLYSTNMQHALISRPLLEKVKREGKLFLSSYPDIYTMSALFLEADRLLIYPNELVVIGISSKSHGYYAINGKDNEAIQFLNAKKEMSEINSLKSVLLPGFIVYTYWLGANELFKCHFDLKKLGLRLDYNVYRNIQINYIYEKFVHNRSEFGSRFKELMKCLTFSEKKMSIFPRLITQLKEETNLNDLMQYLSFSEKVVVIYFLAISYFKEMISSSKFYKTAHRLVSTFLYQGYCIVKKLFPTFLKRICKSFLERLRSFFSKAVSIPISETVPAPQPSYTPLNPPPAFLIPEKEPNRFVTILEIYEQVEPIDCS